VAGKKKPKTERPFRVTDWSVDRTQIRAGERIQLTVSFVNEWEGTETWKGASASFIGQVVPPVDIAAGERVTKTFEFTIPESGTYNLRVDRGGVTSIFVAPSPDAVTEVYTGNRNESEHRVTARNIAGGQPAYVLLEPTPDGAVSGVHVNRLGINPNWLTDYNLTFRQYNRVREGMQPLPRGAHPLSLFNVTHSMQPQDVDSATIQFTIENDTLQTVLGPEPDPASVGLSRYNHTTESWDPVPAEDIAFLGRTETGAYRFEATVPSFSHYAVTARTPAFDVTDVAMDATEVTAGDAVTLTANVTNVGQATGTETVPFVVGRTVVDATNVTLDPGATQTVEFTHATETAGTHNVSVGGVSAGTLSVAEEPTPTPPPTTATPPTTTTAPPTTTTAPPTTAPPTTTTAPAPTTTTTGGGGPGFGAAVALLAMLGAALLALRRR
jgi:PGF-CTERM protein